MKGSHDPPVPTGTEPVSLTILGGLSLSRLKVYDELAPDGVAGGSPHMHTSCAEAYVVLSGHGAVELLSLREGYQRLPLLSGVVVHFEPGVVHRLVNEDRLEILVLMQNSGLPENGDAVFTFPPEDLRDSTTYARRASASSLHDALARRDRAVQGLITLKDGFAVSRETGEQLLREFHGAAVELVTPQVSRWRAVLDAGPAAAVASTYDRLEAIVSGSSSPLAAARVARLVYSDDRLGMCGRLNPLFPEGSGITIETGSSSVRTPEPQTGPVR